MPLVRALAQTQGSGSDDPGAEAPPEVFKSKNLVPHSTLQPPLKPHLRLPLGLSAAPREQPTGRRASGSEGRSFHLRLPLAQAARNSLSNE